MVEALFGERKDGVTRNVLPKICIWVSQLCKHWLSSSSWPWPRWPWSWAPFWRPGWALRTCPEALGWPAWPPGIVDQPFKARVAVELPMVWDSSLPAAKSVVRGKNYFWDSTVIDGVPGELTSWIPMVCWDCDGLKWGGEAQCGWCLYLLIYLKNKNLGVLLCCMQDLLVS